MKFLKFIIFIHLLNHTYCDLLTTSTKCTCSQLLYKNECSLNLSCNWDASTSKCQNSSSSVQIIGYCSTLSKDKCASQTGCAYFNDNCQYFTGCTSYATSSNELCFTINQNCISDGIKCVQKSNCQSYKTQFSCRANYENNQIKNYCYWDSKQSVCRDVKICSELPKNLLTEKACRAQISSCTLNPSGGCQVSGKTCADQSVEEMCVSNYDQTVKCFWNGVSCVDLICASAPQTYTTDIQCKEFLSSCTTKQNGGCVEKQECANATIEAACVSNSKGGLCIWLSNKCVDRICANGTTDMITNQQCQTISANCITKFQGGCVTNGDCETATNSQGCEKDILGNACYWNGFECVRKTCEAASKKILSDSGCKAFLSQCTLHPLGSGCIQQDCKSFDTEASCRGQTDKFNNSCMWVPQCDIGSCSTAPHSYDTHSACETYNSQCTIHPQYQGCVLKQLSCNLYTQIQCQVTLDNKGCVWIDSKCIDRTCSNASTTFTTHKECNSYLSSCTLSDLGYGCMGLKSNCIFNKQNQCYLTADKSECEWQYSYCATKACSTAPVTISYDTISECESYLKQCTIGDRIAKGCVQILDKCEYLQQQQCTQQLDLTQCTWYQNKCVIKDCSNYTGIVNHLNCQTWLSKCTAGPGYNPQICVVKPSTCTDPSITQYQCIVDINNNECAWLSGKCVIKTCESYPNTPTVIDCQNWMSKCTLGTTTCVLKGTCESVGLAQAKCTTDINGNNCVVQSGNCMSRSCTNIALGAKDHATCEAWSSSCTVNTGNDGCETKKSLCSGYLSNQNQCFKTLDGKLCTFNITCKERACDNKNGGPFDHTSCENYLSTCTTNLTSSECITKLNKCSDYKGQGQCVKTLSGKMCFWNGSECIDRSCSQASIDSNYDTDVECKGFLSTCMVAHLGGCQDKQKCQNYVTQDQCKTDFNNQACYWDNSTNKCLSFDCGNAAITNNSHQLCQAFSKQCTTKLDQIGGCVDLLNNCNDYKGNNQCYITKLGVQCYWDKITCRVAQCTDATGLTYINHTKCQEFMKSCTVNNLANGCITLQISCSNYFSQEQCQITLNNVNCYWDPNLFQCRNRTCFDNQGLITITQSICQSYISTCVKSNTSCRIMQCEDYLFKTDSDCKNAKSNCTTNGSYCIERGKCQQALTQYGCVTDSDGQLCGWFDGKCTYLSCNTAPITLTTEYECDRFWPNSNCTTKLGGGCRIKGECTDAQVKEACTTSLAGKKCIWIINSCREVQCSDFRGSTVQACQNQLTGCTTNGEVCQNQRECSTYEKESECLLGTDGACLWFNEKCQLFKGCESVILKTFEECQAFSGNCISNSITCISIKQCEEYQSQVECIKGIDGTCSWISQTNKCQLFTKCSDFLYATHAQCTSINHSCTTNAKECISIQACQSYSNEEQCKVDVNGKIVNSSGQVTATGYCEWDKTICKVQGCSKLKGETHDKCFEQLSSCTTNGVNCVDIQQCNQYTDPYQCSIAYGIDGKCLYQQQCLAKPCLQLTTSECSKQSNCYYNGKACQQKNKCKEYLSQSNCTYGYDGKCIWKSESCSLMTDCQDADSLESVCRSKDLSDKCYWVASTELVTSKCVAMTCEYVYRIGKCQNITIFQSNNQRICRLQDNKCIEIESSALTIDNCYQMSDQYYRWDSTCKTCSSQTNQIDNNNNQTNTPTTNGYLIRIGFSIFMIYIQ